MTYRLVVLRDAGSGGFEQLEVVRRAPMLAAAVVGGIRDVERAGGRVVRIIDGQQQRVLVAADLILRLRGLVTDLSEEEVALLLELLPL